MVESNVDVLFLQVLPVEDEGADQLDRLTATLRDELRETDITGVDPIRQAELPEHAKGAVAAVTGWLAVHFGPAGLRGAVNAVIRWAGRTGRTVELTLNGDTLKVTGASLEMQEQIVNEFFSRVSPPS
jgi:hypothetical protein